MKFVIKQNYITYIILTAIIIFTVSLYYTNQKEGFQTYEQCRNLGYSKEFCVQTPSSIFGPAGCVCPDGSYGRIYPGLRGQCLCGGINNHYIF